MPKAADQRQAVSVSGYLLSVQLGAQPWYSLLPDHRLSPSPSCHLAPHISPPHDPRALLSSLQLVQFS